MSEIKSLNNMLKVATDEWTIKHIKRLLAEAINTAQELKEVRWNNKASDRMRKERLAIYKRPQQYKRQDKSTYVYWTSEWRLWRMKTKPVSEMTDEEIEKEVERGAEQRENSYLQIN